MSLDLLPQGVPLSAIPLALNPDGSPPNFADPPSLAPAVVAVGVTFATLATIFVGLKLTSNLGSKRSLNRVDNAFSVLALLFAYAYTGVAMSFWDTYRHTWDVPLSFLSEAYVKKTHALGYLYGIGSRAAKMALLVLLHRIFNPVKALRVCVYIGITLVTLTHLSAIPLYAALCRPLKGQHWDFMMLEERCAYPTSLHTVIVGAIGTALDIYIWILPLPLIFQLQLPRTKKIGVCLVFMAGLFAIIASGVAMYYRVLMFQGEDLMWNAARAHICGFAETYVIIIVGCAPAIAALWRTTVNSQSSLASRLRSLLGSRSPSSQYASDPKSKSSESSFGTTPSQDSTRLIQTPSAYGLQALPSVRSFPEQARMPSSERRIFKSTQIRVNCE